MKGPITEASAANPGGSDSACEREGAPARMREGTHAREGGAEGKGSSSRPAAGVPGAQARVQARARVSTAAGVNDASTGSWIAVPAMMCTRPAPCAVALIGMTPEVVPTLAGLRRGDLVEVEGELTLADLGDEGARLAVLVAAVRPVLGVGSEVANEA